MEGRSAPVPPHLPEEVVGLLPTDWRRDGGSALDLDAAIESAVAPPLTLSDASSRLIWSALGFSSLTERWAEWLAEVQRLLAEDGIAVIGLAPRERFERLTGEAWDESRIGMTVVDALDDTPRAAVFHSEWWLHSHWGRAFGRLELQERDGVRQVLLGQPLPGITAEEVERPAESDERELAATVANVSYLRLQLDLLTKRHRHELTELREATERELMRRSYAAADLEWARGGPGSPGSLVAAEYEATTSWRLTRPLRALGAMVRRLR